MKTPIATAHSGSSQGAGVPAPAVAPKKIVHLSMPGGGYHAPCGARVGVHSSTYQDGHFTHNPKAEEELKELQSSAHELNAVTCDVCRAACIELVKRYRRARRAKLITW